MPIEIETRENNWTKAYNIVHKTEITINQEKTEYEMNLEDWRLTEKTKWFSRNSMQVVRQARLRPDKKRAGYHHSTV